MFEKNLNIPLLADTYGALLSERKKELLDYYYNEDYSLSEISELTGISRQGIRDSVKKSEAELLGYEEKLGIHKTKTELGIMISDVLKELHAARSNGSLTVSDIDFLILKFEAVYSVL